jgi:hypothetical protein
MIIALEGARGARIVEGNLINRCARDNEANICKWFCGVIGACDVRIAEVGTGVVGGTTAGCDCASAIIKERQQVRRAEGSVECTTGVQGNSVVLVACRPPKTEI